MTTEEGTPALPRSLAGDRRRARSFGADAAAYDAARPTYPTTLIDHLIDDQIRRQGDRGALTVLDVGCGTGKVGRLFVAKGASVLGVEADERMASVARTHGLEVVVSSFEAFEADGRRFDLVVAGQAWHWVDPLLGAHKAAHLLQPGGLLAPFWNLRQRPDPEVAARFDDLYRRLAPELARTDLALGASERARQLDDYLVPIAATGSFEACQVRRFAWQQRYDPLQWRALLETQSDHHLLDPARREPLLDAVALAVQDLGGSLVINYVTVALLARRRA